MTTAAATAAPPQPQSRMTLANVTRGRLEKPRRILLHGVEKIGKSTFAAGAPNAIFICPEDGTAELDVSRFPEPRSWPDVLQAIDTLRTEPHDYQHAVFDTLDWLEPMLWAYLCQRDRKADIHAWGYGKGFDAALVEWRVFVKRLEDLREQRGMHVILLAHSWIKGFKNPLGDDYDRYELKIHQKASGFLREWCDAVLFANFEQFAVKDDKQRVRGVSTGARIIHTERNAAYDAGNRYSLPEQLPLSWSAFDDAVKAGADPVVLTAKIAALLAATNDATLTEKVNAAVAKSPTDGAHLARVLNHLNATLNAKENA